MRSSRVVKQQEHALKRALERYGLILTLNDLGDIKRRVKEGRAERIMRVEKSKTMVMYRLRVRGVDVLVGVGRKGDVITFLPEHAAKKR